MKKCKNCIKDVRDDDKYCRNCGCKIFNNFYYILIDFVIGIISICMFIIIIMFIASYFV